MSWRADVLCPGEATGEVLRFGAPISFWGGVNPETARVTLAGHPQLGETLTDRILVIPEMIGSSSSSAVMLELLHRGIGPKALILGARDAILPIGVVASRHMGWQTIPVFVMDAPPFRSGQRIVMKPDGQILSGNR